MWPAVDLLFTRLHENGGAIALTEGARQLDCNQLLAEVQQRSVRLHQAGARRIALALDNGIDWVLWDLAILHAGLVCVLSAGRCNDKAVDARIQRLFQRSGDRGRRRALTGRVAGG